MNEIRDKATGKKLYPVGRWMTYSHVFYNAVDRAYNAMYDAREEGTTAEIEKAEEWLERCEYLLTKFETNPRKNGIVYASYEDYKTMKDIIGGYAWRHGGTV